MRRYLDWGVASALPTGGLGRDEVLDVGTQIYILARYLSIVDAPVRLNILREVAVDIGLIGIAQGPRLACPSFC